MLPPLNFFRKQQQIAPHLESPERSVYVKRPALPFPGPNKPGRVTYFCRSLKSLLNVAPSGRQRGWRKEGVKRDALRTLQKIDDEGRYGSIG